jgi:hypothetical protein
VASSISKEALDVRIAGNITIRRITIRRRKNPTHQKQSLTKLHVQAAGRK